MTKHVYDRMCELDITLAEFDLLLDGGEVVEETPLPALGRKRVVLVVDWIHPFHVVLVVDRARREERIITVYEPETDRWLPDLRVRRLR
jgi:hypothetical protein